VWGLWWSRLLLWALQFIAASNYSSIAAYINDIGGRYMRPQYQGTRFHPTRKIRNNNGTLSLTLRNGSLSFTLSSRSRIRDVWDRPVTQECIYSAFSESV
jgi:hypothetical protein